MVVAIKALTNPRVHQILAPLNLVPLAGLVNRTGATLNLMDELHDRRGQGAARPAVVDRLSCGAGPSRVCALRAQAGADIADGSVRRRDGQGVATLMPMALSKPRAAGPIGQHWDGGSITHWFGKGAPRVH